jgi:hypothetical protein
LRKDDPSWQRDAILAFLPAAPLLDDFELQSDRHDVGNLQLPPLSSLRKLKITTPYWK